MTAQELKVLTLLGAGFLKTWASAEEYSTNAICRQHNCINPVFPGVTDLALLEASTYQCQPGGLARMHMQFCQDVVNYDVAILSPNTTKPLDQLVAEQEKAAVTTYYYHLAGMNMEGANHKHPELSSDDCVKAVWRLSCNTYFPRAEAGCLRGQKTKYLRPCSNACENYVKSCEVECCDASAKCLFEHTVSLLEGGTEVVTGYTDHEGPSAFCTGAASRSSAPGVLLLGILAFLFPVALEDQGTQRGSSAKAR